ncbi:hypothetical protein ACFOSW_06915 [Paenibacillus sp. GCM10012303]
MTACSICGSIAHQLLVMVSIPSIPAMIVWTISLLAWWKETTSNVPGSQ